MTRMYQERRPTRKLYLMSEWGSTTAKNIPRFWLFNEKEQWKQYGLTCFHSARPLVMQENEVVLDTGEPPGIHLGQPSIRDLKAAIKSLEGGIRKYETPEHRNLEARIKLDADSGEATVTDSGRRAFGDTNRILNTAEGIKRILQRYLDPKKETLSRESRLREWPALNTLASGPG